MAQLQYNGNPWTNDELHLLEMYKGKVRTEHLEKLIPRQTGYDIERKIKEFDDLGIGVNYSVDDILAKEVADND